MNQVDLTNKSKETPSVILMEKLQNFDYLEQWLDGNITFENGGKIMWSKINEEVINEFYGGEKYNPKMFNMFVRNNEIVSYFRTYEQDWYRFLKYGRDTFGYPHIQTESMPFADHYSAFKTFYGAICYVSQPYAEAEAVYPILNKWVADRNLAVDVYGTEHSWYYPRSTCLIILHLPDAKFEVI